MDIVLGYGAHPDPASELGPAIEQARQIARDRGRDLVILLSIIGTDADPQNPSHQKSIFEQCGAMVLESNAGAAQLAAMIISP
jgi:FdrA protein